MLILQMLTTLLSLPIEIDSFSGTRFNILQKMEFLPNATMRSVLFPLEFTRAIPLLQSRQYCTLFSHIYPHSIKKLSKRSKKEEKRGKGAEGIGNRNSFEIAFFLATRRVE
ncbi:hypothetical protein QUB33_00820 [Microcoleus sp. B3-A4]|uniref:hypothetical protein n=1 Tax=Microcoleus sp. B3-A4 TaxID=2818653 RepID=UPI002FCE979A